MTEEKKQSAFAGKSEKRFVRKTKRGKGRPEKEAREFDQEILDIARVTRVTAGGKRMRFRVCMVIGDRKGRVGIGLAKAADVPAAIEKSIRQAKKRMMQVNIVNETIPHRVEMKYGASRVILKPAPKGTGLKSGGAVRAVLTLAGIPNAVSKIVGGTNKVNCARATMNALATMKKSKRHLAPRPKSEANVQ
ncbi:MAG: 30S ribosomal protein S5 [uncultured bacterium]|nr:MAG: 30S ribosomal protein S5 [uncultured bacterium]HBD05280.1 30S ribosomal protein S5 [Candidatus Uhrbacteria bacterium]